MEQITPEQIAEWKEKYGSVYEIEVDGKKCYLHKPSRKTLSAATIAAQRDPLKYNEVVLNNCWIAGDAEIKTDDALYLGVSGQLSEIVEIKEASLKKL